MLLPGWSLILGITCEGHAPSTMAAWLREGRASCRGDVRKLPYAAVASFFQFANSHSTMFPSLACSGLVSCQLTPPCNLTIGHNTAGRTDLANSVYCALGTARSTSSNQSACPLTFRLRSAPPYCAAGYRWNSACEGYFHEGGPLKQPQISWTHADQHMFIINKRNKAAGHGMEIQ